MKDDNLTAEEIAEYKARYPKAFAEHGDSLPEGLITTALKTFETMTIDEAYSQMIGMSLFIAAFEAMASSNPLIGIYKKKSAAKA